MSDTVIDFIIKNILWILFVGYAIVYVFKSIASAGKDIESVGERSAKQREFRSRVPRAEQSRPERGGDDFDAARRMVEEMTRRAHQFEGGDSYTPSPEDFAQDGDISDWDLRQQEIRRENARAKSVRRIDSRPQAAHSAPYTQSAETAAAYADSAHSADIASQLSEIMDTLKTQNAKVSDMSAYDIEDSNSKKSAYAGGAFFDDASSLRRAVIASEILGKPAALRNNLDNYRY